MTSSTAYSLKIGFKDCCYLRAGNECNVAHARTPVAGHNANLDLCVHYRSMKVKVFCCCGITSLLKLRRSSANLLLMIDLAR
jgi:hypothetical protein